MQSFTIVLLDVVIGRFLIPKDKIMIIKRVLYCVGSAIIAMCLLAILLTSMSSATAAQIDSENTTNPTSSSVNDRWRILADMVTGRGDPGVAAHNNKVYVFSGYYPFAFGYPPNMEVYDPQTNTWQYIVGFPNARSDMVVVPVGDKIYAIGGWNATQGGPQGFNDQYDPATNTWITRTSLKTPVSGAAGVVISNSIYVIGGYNGISDTKHVQIYDIM
jgi:N-acetylneuraminic acid mutarotase